MKNDYGRDIIELLEAVAYLICQDDPITSNTFHAIMTSKSVSRKMMRLADTNRDEAVSVEELMNFIVYITKVHGFNNISLALLLGSIHKGRPPPPCPLFGQKYSIRFTNPPLLCLLFG